MEVKIINNSKFELPNYATKYSAGLDLKVDLTRKVDVIGIIDYNYDDKTILENNIPVNPIKNIIIHPQTRCVIRTGLFIQLPVGFEAQIRPRSGTSFKKGLSILNSPGTIDCDYTGEIGIIVGNFTNELICIEHGERIAQMVLTHYFNIEWNTVKTLNKTERGEGGFGHTGVN